MQECRVVTGRAVKSSVRYVYATCMLRVTLQGLGFRLGTVLIKREIKMNGIPATMFKWQGVAMDPLKFHTGPPCPTLLCPVGRPPLKQLYGRFRSSPQGGQPTAVFHPFRHPTPYAYASFCQFNNKEPTRPVRSRARSKIMVKEKIGRVWSRHGSQWYKSRHGSQ
jgi:hypothetical protein